MGTAALICLATAAFAWLLTWHHYREAERVGGLQALGILFYGPIACVTTGLALLFGVIWALS